METKKGILPEEGRERGTKVEHLDVCRSALKKGGIPRTVEVTVVS